MYVFTVSDSLVSKTNHLLMDISCQTSVMHMFLPFIGSANSTMKYKTSLSSAAKPPAPQGLGTAPKFSLRVRNQYNRQGETIELRCRVDGQPQPIVSWEKEGHVVTPSDHIRVRVKIR